MPWKNFLECKIKNKNHNLVQFFKHNSYTLDLFALKLLNIMVELQTMKTKYKYTNYKTQMK